MKYLAFILFLALVYYNCTDDDVNPGSLTPCLEQKFEDWKQDPGAESIVRIERPNDTLYWFVDVVADGFEEVVSSNCLFVCVTDCNCITEHGCDPGIFSFPRTVLWSK